MPDAGGTNNNQGMAGEQLRSFIERVERLREEVRAINSDVSEVYKEAKAMGFDVKVMKMLVAERSKPEHELLETQEILDLYRNAVNGTPVALRATRAGAHE